MHLGYAELVTYLGLGHVAVETHHQSLLPVGELAQMPPNRLHFHGPLQSRVIAAEPVLKGAGVARRAQRPLELQTTHAWYAPGRGRAAGMSGKEFPDQNKGPEGHEQITATDPTKQPEATDPQPPAPGKDATATTATVTDPYAK